MKRVTINCKKRIVDSIIGRHSYIESVDQLPPSARREHPVQNIIYLSLAKTHLPPGIGSQRITSVFNSTTG
jgi:hypothetical protein